MKIIAYPIGDNPYQTLLYNEFKKNKKVEIKYLRNEFIDTKHAFTIGMPIFPFRLLYHRLKGWDVMHLHWLSPFVLPGENKYMRYISSLYILSFLILIKILRFRLVWTLHETLPQEDEFHDDKIIRGIVSKFSDITIFHSPAALEEAKELGFNTKNAYIIPHGNYTTSYLNNTSEEKARVKLKLQKDDFVFLFFGMVKPYKGIDDLLENFDKILQENKKIKLIIAGECTSKKLKEIILKYKNSNKNNVQLYLHHINADDIQYFLNASDVVVLPFKKNTTSGSAILALSFGKPIIAPLLGNIIDLPKKIGLFYKPLNNNGLLSAMKKALSDKKALKKTGQEGLKYSESLVWDKIGLKTKNTFDRLSLIAFSMGISL